jgi:hypothetical protein
MKKILLLTFILFFGIRVNAETEAPSETQKETQKEPYYAFLYSIEPDDSFASVLRLFVKDDMIINKRTPLVNKIMKNNSHIKDWNTLPSGQIITLFIPPSVLDTAKYKKVFTDRRMKIEAAKKVMEEMTSTTEGLKGSAFYMASVGDFKQSSPLGTNVTYNQNSYGTFGFQGNYYPKNSLYSFASSLYVSVFTPADTILPPNNVTLPPEIGFNAYGEYLWKPHAITFHGGFDYEKFSSFNLIGIEEQQRIYLDRLSVIYLTAGLSHVFKIFNVPLFTKFSISKSITSTTTSDYTSTLVAKPESLSGVKALFYLNYKFTDKLFFHSMFKYHKMSGPSELSSMRLGVGIGYILF